MNRISSLAIVISIAISVSCSATECPSDDVRISWDRSTYCQITEMPLADGTVEPNGFMTYLKRLVENGIDQPALAKKGAEEKKAKKHEVPVNHPKTKNVVSVDSSSTNVSKQKYYAKKSNSKTSLD